MIIDKKHINFENDYIKIRQKENRVYSDDEVKNLPWISPNKQQESEWRLRSSSTGQFFEYVKNQDPKNILDLACGNGWFTHLLKEKFPNSEVLGMDINALELEQGKRCFNQEGLSFKREDIFNHTPNDLYDLITINAGVQYFPDVKLLMKKLFSILAVNGVVHILDSPVYKNKKDANAAKLRSDMYYNSLGLDIKSDFYFHHTIFDFQDFEVLREPSKNKFWRKINKQSPLSWLKCKKVS